MEMLRPAEIETRSMQIIRRELAERGIVLPEENAPVIERVIHTTADFDYVENLRFSGTAVREGTDAVKRGTVLITDTNMALAGISRPGLKKLGAEARCFMAEPEITEIAAERGCTRAAASVGKAAAEFPGCVYAVGNAPTALMEIAKKIEEGFRPSLVIAVPVGFVNVVDAKELIWDTCLRSGIPVIAAMGRKGGSNVAAAVCNALIYLASDLLDPSARSL